ncbi:Ubiquitin C-terminal hydrolase 22 [Hirschfeldia incana]|nr:Ubiquitin C-terminal hydrolase 22 [Hirschfeldia incana]
MSARKHPDPCNHLSDYKLRHGTDGYKSFQNMFTCLNDGRIKIKLQQETTPRCSSHCSLHSNKRLYICLICRSISCSSHLLSHTQSNKGHDLSIDVERSELYCSSCVDQVYDPDFDEAVVSKHLVKDAAVVSGGVVRSNKKRRLSADAQLIIGSKQFLVDRREKWSFPLGLRGLNNLGSTCFMNAVLQALVHAPPLRNFWLSGQHNRDLCERRSMGLLCLPCDLDVIFSAMFSGDRTPYSPAHLLYSWWQHSTNLATYEQQDSHEFFISLLDCIHENEGKSKCLYKDHEECQCITHRAFSGLLRSDVTCTTCGTTSTTYDPFIDISLTLDSSTDRRKSRNSGGEPSVNAPMMMPTLSGCLDLFTRSEKLGPDQKLNCQSCGDKRESSKQMSIRRLPPLLCLHVKRFEHSLTRKASRKIDSYLQYPFRLNMSPYLSSSIIGKRFGNRMFAFDGEGEHDGSSASEFEIFAVVTHSGMLASGHYVTYLRLKGLWYRCDDAWINEVEEEVVRGCECYMLFYAQERVIQKAHKELSYQVISMADSFPFV